MATNDPQLVHLDKMLSRISVGYTNNAMVGDRLFQTVRVNKQSDKYYVFRRRETFQTHDMRRTPGSQANELPPMTLSRETYFAQEDALVSVVPVEERENADPPLNPYNEETERLSEAILLGREDAIQSMVRDSSNYPASHVVTLSGTDQWNDYAGSDPKSDVKTGRQQIHNGGLLKEPNVMIAGYDVGIELEDHTQFIERIKYSERGVTTEAIIAQVLGIGNLIFAGVAHDDSNPAAAEASLSLLWGKDAILAYVPPRPGRRVPAFGYEFAWPYRNGQVMPTERWYDDDRVSDKVRTRRRYDLKFIAKDGSDLSIAGYLIKDAVA